MGFEMKYDIIPRYLTAKSMRRSGSPLQRVVFIVAHDTGNVNSTAGQNVSYYESSCNEISASAHLFVDDKEIVECIPALTGTPEKAWHVRYNVNYDNQLFGVDANDTAIGVELCYSDNGSINNEEAYKRYVWLLAYICYRFGLDPSTSIVGHGTLDPMRRVDPSDALRQTGRTFAALIQDVVLEFSCSSGIEKTIPTPLPIGKATVVVEKLNVRSGPNLNSSIVKVVNKGESYQVFSEQDGWYNVGKNEWFRAKSEYVSFTSSRTSSLPASVLQREAREGVATILVNALHVRSEPSLDGGIVKVVNRGEVYHVFYEQNGWYNVGGNEWISANPQYVKFELKG